MNISLSSPNTMVCNYFSALRRAVYRVLEESDSDNEKRQECAVCIFLAVTAVETFLNVFFRVVVEEEPFTAHKSQLLADIRKQFSLARKLEKWPRDILGRSLSDIAGPGREFAALRDLRNKLMHFTSSHQTIEIPGATIHGLADTSSYDRLGNDDARRALRVAEDVLAEIFRLRGISVDQIPHALHLWTGRPPV